MNISDQTITIIQYSIIAIFAVYLLVLMYYGIKYYRHKNHVALTQRYASISIVEVILSCALLVVDGIELLYFNEELNITWSVCSTALVSCWVLRYWLITFDIKWNILMLNEQWMSVIDPSLTNAINSSFIVRKKNTLGNFRWLLYRLVIPWNIFCCVAAVVIIYKFNTDITIIILFAFEVWMPWILLFIIYWNLPVFHDNFFISQELKLLITVFVFFILCNIVWNFIYLKYDIIQTSHFSANSPISIVFLFIHFLQQTILTIDMLIATWWVLNKVKKIIVVTNNRRTTISQRTDEILLSHIKHDTFEMDSFVKSQLMQIFKNKDAFELYINHLSKEFSMPFLLALVEFIQIQKWILSENVEYDEMILNGLVCQTFEFYDKIPQSSIVFVQDELGQNILQTIKQKSNQLYWKYIEYGVGHFEILLSKETRNNISDVMSHIDWIENDEISVNDILMLFNECCHDIFEILIDGFGRFQATQHYIQLNLQRPVYDQVMLN